MPVGTLNAPTRFDHQPLKQPYRVTERFQSATIPVLNSCDDPTAGWQMDESKNTDLTSQGNAVAPRELGMVHDLESRLSQQVENWRKKLLDLGNRNSLINCSFSKTHGVVEILHPNTETVWRKLAADNEAGAAMMRFPWRRDLVPMPRKLQEEVDSGEEEEWDPPFNECLVSQKFRPTDLMTGTTDKVLNRRFRTLANHAELSLSEQGVHCLYVAFGFLKWFESVDSDQELRSPLMLVPVSLNRSTSDAPWELAEAEDDALENLCLRQRLKQDFGLELPSLPDIDVLEEEGARLQFLDAVRQAISENTRWQVEDRCAIGRFAFPKIAMWKNLGEHRNEVISHPICRSIAGDSSVSPMQAFGSTTGLPNASQLDDELAPGEIKAILDCDSSQIEAIVAAKRGVSFVLDGPPGTGKSQTIANIIADALAEGRRVLFVSEKVSALEVVKRRLDEFGLGDFCLECHSSKANRASVLEKLRMCMEIPTEVYPDPSPKLAEAGRLRDSLNKYVRAVHASRPPLGLSPYELYGHISRLERLGMATRSRCRLPDSSSVTRDTFQSWLRVLERAEDLGDVLQTYATHPWRGCHLTSRSLSFSDDMQHHFGVLSKSFREIAEVTQPLVTAGLLPPVTPASHGETTKTLREAVQAPEVPSSWFSHATTVAKQVLARHASRTKREESLFGLGDYVDDVLSRFPAEIAKSLNAEPAEPWLCQIVDPLPDSIREQDRLIVRSATLLDDVAHKSDALNLAVRSLIEQLRIPIQSKIAIAVIPQLVRFARNVAGCSPMREGWFASDNWTRLRQCSLDAIGNLDDAERLASTLRGRLTAENIPQLCRAMPEPQLLESAWSRVQLLVPTDTVHEIQEQRTRLQKLSEALLRTIESVGVVCRQMGINDTSSVSFEAAHSLATWGVSLAQPVTMLGAWTDIATRIKVRKIAEESISDLLEAGEVRQSLEDRLSHRAFKSSAADLAHRAAAFGSAFKRMFGGFGGIRKEAAELYKQGVPATQQLLSDMERLCVYHRRMGEAEDAAAEYGARLPPSHTGGEVDAWKHVLTSVLALDGMCQAVPSLAVQLSVEAKNLDPIIVKTGSEALRNQLDQLRGLLDETGAMLRGREGDSLASIAERVGAAAVDLKTCCDVADTAHRFFEQLPLTFPHLLTDVLNAFRCSEALVEATALFEREREIMSHGSTPSDRHGWERVIAGVDVAEFLNRLVPNDTSVRDLFCREGSLDTAGLTLAGDSAELALQDLHLSLVKAEAIVSVSTPGAVAVAPSRRTPGELRHLADTGARQLNSKAVRLRQVSDVVRTDCDVPLSRLADDAASIGKARDQDRVIAETETSLRDLGVELPDQLLSQGLDAAKWLITAAASGSIHPLLEKAASDPTILAQCQLAAERNRAACHAEFLKSWKFLQSVFDVKTEMSSGQTPFATDFDQLADILDRLRGETESLESWLKFIRWRRDMSAAGFDEVVRELLDQKYEPEQAVDAVSARFYRSLFDHLISEDTSLAEFDIDTHERLRERFRELDQWEVRAAATRIRQYQLGRNDRPRPGELIPGSSELGILMREVKKKRGHMPLRKLFAAIPKVLQALKPCIMMSPLSVSTFLQSNDIRFDLVIFDEASQVFPWDAMGAIYRGNQLIVAGDEQQLPPTNFFSRGDVESEDEDDEIGDFESILSVCKSIRALSPFLFSPTSITRTHSS